MAMAAVECDNKAGTSMLARRLTTILPAMTLAEALETTRIHRVAGRTGDHTACVTDYPASV
jgi:magnesium chelatase family protein